MDSILFQNSKMKKDIANRLGHKERYIRLKKEETIDL